MSEHGFINFSDGRSIVWVYKDCEFEYCMCSDLISGKDDVLFENAVAELCPDDEMPAQVKIVNDEWVCRISPYSDS